jgi:hypothetical protein
MSIIAFPNRNGGFVFTCTGCGFDIRTAVWDGFPVCLTCRWFDERPQIPRKVRDRVCGVTRDSSNNENGCGNG